MNELEKLLLSLNQTDYDPHIVHMFLTFIRSQKYIRDTNPEQHLCSFFVPIHIESKSVYMGNHRKAGFWIPPGGHIDPEEMPIDAAAREIQEELQYKVHQQDLHLFFLSITDIAQSKRPCKTHYDFWYYISTPKIPFLYDKNEFHDARWMNITEAIELTKGNEAKTSLQKLNVII